MLRNLFGSTLVLVLSGTTLLAQDWSNAGGNPGRSGRTDAIGPNAATISWQGSRSSIIAWQPVTMGGTVFMVRQASFPPLPTSPTPGDSLVVGHDIATGTELWAAQVPSVAGDWTAWIAGARDGRVYVSRSGNGASVESKLRALNAATGAQVWESAALIDAGAYDGVVFASDGDLIIASFRDIWRINAEDGATVWQASRVGSVSGNCGGCVNESAAGGSAVYVADAAAGGTVIKRFDLDTGAFEYQSPVMPGFTIQTTPMVGPDGTVYLPRVQNNATVDFFYSIKDDGSAMSVNWSVPGDYCYANEFTIGNDGSVYMYAPGHVIMRLDPATGATLNTSTQITTSFPAAPRMACDGAGNIYVSTGTFSDGRMYCFSPDLVEVWSEAITNINIGGPCIAADGTLIVAGVGTNVKAFRTESACYADCDGSGSLDFFDFLCFQNEFAAGAAYADCDQSGSLDFFDFLCFQNEFAAGCP